MRSSFIVLGLILASLSGFAQNGKVISAWNYYTFYLEDKNDQKSLLSARDAIDLAVTHEKTMGKAKTWFYKGLIYQAFVESRNDDLLKLQPNALSEAVAAYRKAAELDANKKHRVDITENLSSLAIYLDHYAGTAFNKGDFQKAYELFGESYRLMDFLFRAYDKRVIDTAAMIGFGYAADRVGKKDEALKVYEELIAINVSDPAIYLSLALAYKQKGDTAKAIEILGQGQDLNPGNVDIIIEQVNIFLVQGRNSELIAKLDKAISLDPGNYQLYYALGTVYDRMNTVERQKENKDRRQDYLQKNTKRARELYNKSLELKPDNYDVIYNLGALLFNEAATDIQGTINDLTTEQGADRKRLISTRDELLHKAIPFFDKALTMKDSDLNSLIALKEIYQRLEMNPELKKVESKINGIKRK